MKNHINQTLVDPVHDRTWTLDTEIWVHVSITSYQLFIELFTRATVFVPGTFVLCCIRVLGNSSHSSSGLPHLPVLENLMVTVTTASFLPVYNQVQPALQPRASRLPGPLRWANKVESAIYSADMGRLRRSACTWRPRPSPPRHLPLTFH
jgi:hypothetical protein